VSEMLSLTRIFLHNWHRFGHSVIDVKDSLYLAGHNGSGKSSLLDAMQLVLVANMKRIRFNSSAQDASDRDVDTYARGKLGEDRWLRPGRAVAYVALEFTPVTTGAPTFGSNSNGHSRNGPADIDTPKDGTVTLGVCVEAEPGRSSERTYFIHTGALNPDVFVPEGRPLTRLQLRKLFRERPGARAYDHVEEYQADMLDKLGGLSERFFDLFLRALYFRPISNIDDFVEQWLLEKKELSLDTLRNVRERLRDLRAESERTTQRVQRLNQIVAQQQEVKRLGGLRDQYALLAVLLRAESAARALRQLDETIASHERELNATRESLEQYEVTLSGAEQALNDARKRLYESDVARRRDELAQHIEQIKRDAEAITARWHALRTDLQAQGAALKALLDTPDECVDEMEKARLRGFVDAVAALTADQAPPPQLRGEMDALAEHLSTAHARAVERRALLKGRADEVRDRAERLRAEVEALQKQGAIRYRPEVERMQDRLQAVLGERPKLLCELLEISDPRWQDAVEAMLGPRRFNIVVPPQQFAQAMRELDRVRAAEQLYDVGLVDLERASKEARAVRPNSLARCVTAQLPAVAEYVSYVLGDIIACDSADELRRYRRAVTPEVVVYAEFTVRATRPERYRPHFIGARARQSQIDTRKRDLADAQRQWEMLNRQVQDAQAAERLLNQRATLARLAERLNADLDAGPLREQLAQTKAEMQMLDMGSLAELEREIEQLKAQAERDRAEQRRLDQLHGTLSGKLGDLRAQRLAGERAAAEWRGEVERARGQYEHAVGAAEALLLERLDRPDLDDEVSKAESGARRFDTQRANEAQRLAELGAQYNTTEQFAARAGDADEPRYAQERERLMATDLPTYEARIDQAAHEAEDELREHVLHTLREQISTARRKLDQINDALGQLPPFGHERYRFTCAKAEDAEEFYDLIMADAQLLGSGSLFESQFYAEHKPAFDRFYDALTQRAQSRAEEEEQERLTDYRHYLSYDIEVTNTVTGQKSRLSRIMNQTSGGETQTPFYLTIAASFVQLYRLQEHNRRPTIRLVAFDEAFSKMDQSRIGATLDLFQRFNLQVVTATPLERCEYLAPKICTSLVLSAVKDSVHIEPYHNFAARLGGAAFEDEEGLAVSRSDA
jgi:uncharacterized protein YPO0396